MPLKKKKIKEEEKWEGVGNSMKEHKEEMKKIWTKEKEPKPHKTWKEHNAWLDTFRSKIITGKGDK